MKKHFSLIGIFVAMLACVSYAPKIEKQQYTYEVKMGHRLLGELKVTKQEMGDREAFKFHQITEDGLLHKSKVEYTMLSMYEYGKLTNMEMRNVMDDVLLQSADMKLVDGVYQLKTDLGNMEIPEGDLRPGSAQMFFGEPDGLSSVFHEKHGQNVELCKKADNIYEVVLPNGGREVYTYKDGKLYYVLIDKTFGTFSLTIKDPRNQLSASR
jgi:hypothetical protein